MLNRIAAALAGLAAAALAAPAPAAFWGQSCKYAYDGECDESSGTGVCAEGSDAWDCRREGAPPGAESCPLSHNGACDELEGTGRCIPHTDTADCVASGIDQDRLFFGHDDRIWPDSTILPWRAIGRVTLASGGHCSGSLVAPDVVLTAAHCVFADTQPVAFFAGASGTRHVASARVIGEVTPPRYDVDRERASENVDGFDWAFLILDEPIGERTGWLELMPLTEAELARAVAGEWLLMQGGYSSDAGTFLSANVGCRIVKVWDDNTIYHRCDTLTGDSGSPLFVQEGSRYRIIAVESASIANQPYDDYMAVDARAFYPFSRKLLRN